MAQKTFFFLFLIYVLDYVLGNYVQYVKWFTLIYCPCLVKYMDIRLHL